ncbi:hypothetical protein HDK90DRAFT_515734 [Phyllosticta capitalensis]|uniref:Gfd2/YDR514C-like C-terminal domain-containing protein n=1 Tax=Phyllosticta capitalensis TaxID=121624 RepID=A0ABR1Y9A9_9PEZI
MRDGGDVQAIRGLRVEIPQCVKLLDQQQINPPRRTDDGSLYSLGPRYAVEELGLSYQHAHNASNDATWTLVSRLATGINSLIQQTTGLPLDLGSTIKDGVFIPSLPAAVQTLHIKNADKLMFSLDEIMTEATVNKKHNKEKRRIPLLVVRGYRNLAVDDYRDLETADGNLEAAVDSKGAMQETAMGIYQQLQKQGTGMQLAIHQDQEPQDDYEQAAPVTSSATSENQFQLQDSDFLSLQDAKRQSTAPRKELSSAPEPGTLASPSSKNGSLSPYSADGSTESSSSPFSRFPLASPSEGRMPLSTLPEASMRLASPSSSSSLAVGAQSALAPQSLEPRPTASRKIKIREDRAYHTSQWNYAIRKSFRLIAFDEERYIPKHSRETPEIQEVGIAVFDPHWMPDRFKWNFTHPAWLTTAISLIKTRHVRIQEVTSLVNDRNVPPNFFVCPGGCQDHALYCKTEVVKRENVGQIVSSHLDEKEKDGSAAFRPAALLMQGSGDVATIENLGIDIKTDHVRLLDLQQINEQRIDNYGHAHPLALRHAVEQLGLAYTHAHNASNDATWTLISGLATGIDQIVFYRTHQRISFQGRYFKESFIPSVAAAVAALHQKNNNKLHFKTSVQRQEAPENKVQAKGTKKKKAPK